MNFFREWVLHNWHLKLLALLTSFLLWAGYTSEPFVEVGYTVPLEFRNIPEQLDVSSDAPTQVQVRVRGRSIVLRRLSPADLAIAVDLAHDTAGEMLVRITPSQMTLPPGAEVVRITPSEIHVRLLPRTPEP